MFKCFIKKTALLTSDRVDGPQKVFIIFVQATQMVQTQKVSTPRTQGVRISELENNSTFPSACEYRRDLFLASARCKLDFAETECDDI